MRQIYLIVFALLLGLQTICNAQEKGNYRIIHLTKQEFKNQIQICSDSAYLELGITEYPSKYDDNSHEWLTSMIDKVIEKHFANDFSEPDSLNPNVIDYMITWERKDKNLTYNISFFKYGKYLGSTGILFDRLNESSVPPIKIFSSKKKIRKILQREIKN